MGISFSRYLVMKPIFDQSLDENSRGFILWGPRMLVQTTNGQTDGPTLLAWLKNEVTGTLLDLSII